MKKLLLPVLALAVAFTSCKKDNDKQTLFKGAVKDFQMGKAWTWYETDGAGKPMRLAIAIDEAAMNTLDRSIPGEGNNHMHENDIVLTFPAQVSASTPFNHVGLGWNPHGHEPEFIYGLPHFDFHFYEITPEQVAAIPLYDDAPEKFDNAPAADYFPANYFNPGGGVPQMGVHWLDATSPEFNGQTFTQTFIYGSYDGKVTFYEPMITEAFILNNPSFQRAIPQPAKFQKSGYYPTKMRIQKTAGVTNIILEDFVYRTQS
jgi:hypothetical protein